MHNTVIVLCAHVLTSAYCVALSIHCLNLLYIKDLYFNTVSLAYHIGQVGLQDSAQLSLRPAYRTYRYYTGMKGIAPNAIHHLHTAVLQLQFGPGFPVAFT